MNLIIDNLGISNDLKNIFIGYLETLDRNKTIQEIEEDWIFDAVMQKARFDSEKFIKAGYPLFHEVDGAPIQLSLPFKAKNGFESHYPHYLGFSSRCMLNEFLLGIGIIRLTEDIKSLTGFDQYSVGSKIRTFSLTKCKSLSEYAKLIGASPQQLHQYTKENREPGTSVLTRFAETGMDINWLLDKKRSCSEIIIDRDSTSPDYFAMMPIFLKKVLRLSDNPSLLGLLSFVVGLEKLRFKEFDLIRFVNSFTNSLKKMNNVLIGKS